MIDNAGEDEGVQHALPLPMDLPMDIRGVEIFELRITSDKVSLGFKVSCYSPEEERKITTEIVENEREYISLLKYDKVIMSEHSYGLVSTPSKFYLHPHLLSIYML